VRIIISISGGYDVSKLETNTRKIIARLQREGWINIGGGGHDRFVNDTHPGVMITVPRHKEVSLGVARSIAKAAGWI
jgi:predicted RNA binding protein YcfA (HicA-like mRNA interferase family)